MSSLRRAALGLASRGLQVFPIIPKGKTPATAHGLLDATVDLARIERWWAACPSPLRRRASPSARGRSEQAERWAKIVGLRLQTLARSSLRLG